MGFFEGTGMRTAEEMEETLTEMVRMYVCEVASRYTEAVDDEIREAKSERRAAGYRIERRGDERHYLTRFGELNFQRTYYRGTEGYVYLVDQVLGIEQGERISKGIKKALSEAALDMSYEQSRQKVCEGVVSRTSVMNAVRASSSQPVSELDVKQKVPNLHIDADEDHVTLIGGRGSIVPLISVYEGIERQGQRGVCKNIFHISEYGKSADDLWEQVLTRIEEQYDLEDTQVYLHGDGASWIQRGLEWIPNTIFVLDKYHKNKAIKEMTVGLEPRLRREAEVRIRLMLSQGDDVSLSAISIELMDRQPERISKIRKASRYLRTHLEAIEICAKELEANNGGCTEPHVSNRLSRRLSSRPMAWSKRTLERLAPLLAQRTPIIIGHAASSIRNEKSASILLSGAERRRIKAPESRKNNNNPHPRSHWRVAFASTWTS